MSWILTGVSLAFIYWSWGIAWGRISVRGGGEGADAMGRGLAVAFTGLIGIVFGLVALVWALIAQPTLVGKLFPLLPFLALGAIWIQNTLWYRRADREYRASLQAPQPWLVVDADPARRAAVVADVRRLDHRHVVTELAHLDELAGLDQAAVDGLKVVVLTAADVLGLDPDRREEGRQLIYRRLNTMVPVILLSPDEATAEAAVSILNRMGTFSTYNVQATDVESLKGSWAMNLPRFKPPN